MEQVYTAAKAQIQNRPGWVVRFRHPLRKDGRGKPGLKVQRGLGTTDAAEADALVAQLNAILADPAWWSATKRQEAARAFSSVIVNAFFDELQAGAPNAAGLREQQLPLPWRDEGYSRALFVGTTGAGKTTLLRHFIGSDHEEDRFPSTSTAKTTVADIEIILAAAPFSAVVTFETEHEVQANVEECLVDAVIAVWDGKRDMAVAERLLNHRDQRFRLSYILGRYDEGVVEDEGDFSFEDDDSAVSQEDSERQLANSQALQSYIGRIRAVTSLAVQHVSETLGDDISALTGSDREACQEFIEDTLWDMPEFSSIAYDILNDVRDRFDWLGAGELVRNRSGWPQQWLFATDDRETFIKEVRWFASNYAPEFGRLLTPVVNGIRVSGPLYPDFATSKPKLVLLDGQGLGHTPESSSSVTTQITKRFADVDVILLVDNAQQPMQAGPLSVLRAVATSGYQQKLAVAFTHFDHVKGANLPTFSAKRAHVLASLTNGLTNLRDALGQSAVIRAMERTLEDRCFWLGGLDRPGKALPNGFRSELARLLSHFEAAVVVPAPPAACPQYNMDGLPLAVQAAATGFQRPWHARLGLGYHDAVSKEHWTRVKALTRRVAAEFYPPEYDSLRPVADLVARLTEEVSRFLDNPVSWSPEEPDEETQEAAIDLIRQEVNTALYAIVERRLIDEPLSEWRRAFDLRGRGSTFTRAQLLRDVLEEAAPVPASVMTPPAREFLNEIREIVLQAVSRRQNEE